MRGRKGMGTQGKAYLDALGCLAHLFAFGLFLSCLVELPEHVPAKLHTGCGSRVLSRR